jgi:hypothetical protein
MFIRGDGTGWHDKQRLAHIFGSSFLSQQRLSCGMTVLAAASKNSLAEPGEIAPPRLAWFIRNKPHWTGDERSGGLTRFNACLPLGPVPRRSPSR